MSANQAPHQAPDEPVARVLALEGQRIRNARWKAANPEKVKAYNAAYGPAYRAGHREEARAYHAKRYAANPGRWVKYQAEHREQRRQNSAKWWAAHPGYLAIWRATDPERTKLYYVNRNHRKRANGGNFRRPAWEHLKVLFGHRCAYCERRMERLTQDHVIPISKGGRHFSGNIVPACLSCNSRKGARHGESPSETA